MNLYRLAPSGNHVEMRDLLDTRGKDFSLAFSQWTGLPPEQIFFVNSGAAALNLALLGMRKLEPTRNKVVIPAWCCPSVPQAILQADLTPVLSDLSPVTLNYDHADLQRVCLEEAHPPLAVLHVHFFGIPQTPPACSYTAAFQLRDVAQDFNHLPGQDGIPAFYSFAKGKALNAGHGGALCFPNRSLLWEACREEIRDWPYDSDWSFAKVSAINQLSRPRVYWLPENLPFLALGRTVWKAPLHFARLAPQFKGPGAVCLDAYVKRHDYYRELTGRYAELLSRCDKDRVTLPFRNYGLEAPDRNVPLRFPILIKDPRARNNLYLELNARFGGVTRMYPATLPRLENAPTEAFPPRAYPGAEKVARSILTFPVLFQIREFEGRFLRELHELLMENALLSARAAA